VATPAERKALLFLAAVVFLGAGVRAVRAISDERPSDSAPSVALDEQRRLVDSARAGPKRGRRKASDRQPAPPAPVDLDTAPAELIETLNGVGPALAKRIAADRDSFGAFGSIEALERVRGVGPALAAKLAPQVTFSRLPRPQNAVVAPPPGRRTARKKSQRDRVFP
jgi:competence protein ComEA